MKPKLRVQQYDSAASFLRNSSKFLIQNETMNNLFWEVTKNWQFGKKINWAGSVFQNHKIGLSAIWMKTGYILLSRGKAEAIKRLVDYGRAKQWEVKGIMGAGEIVEKFSSRWDEKSELSRKNFTKRFIIYESTRPYNAKITEKSGNLELVQASEFEWPRIRLWAANFAQEASPVLNREATIMMAKSMLKNKNLYLLKNGIQSLGMAGFGRNTPNRMVINMVFTPPEFRGKKYASHLVSLMIKKAQKNGFSHTLLFSDYLEQKNLYQTIGYKPVGEFCEMKLFK